MTAIRRGERQQEFIEFVVSRLRIEPLSTEDLYAKAKSAMPWYCDDDEWTSSSTTRPPEPVWKHDLRWAQQQAKRQGLIRRVGRQWELVT